MNRIVLGHEKMHTQMEKSCSTYLSSQVTSENGHLSCTEKIASAVKNRGFYEGPKPNISDEVNLFGATTDLLLS